MLILFVLFFGLTVWLGCYLAIRVPSDNLLRWTGFALLLYAAFFASQLVLNTALTGWLFLIGLIMLVVDIVAARRGILDLGEIFWPDFIRSLDGALLAALLFGMPVAGVIQFATGVTPAMLLLLLVIVAIAIAMQVLAEPIQRALDQVAFAAQPKLQQTRAELRAAAEALPKVDEAANPAHFEAAEFVRHTRRALSHYGDLARLATNPLTRLPIIDARLAVNGSAEHTLARASELKRLLYEAICHLKPAETNDFNASDEWRHYNALYYPYVIGLKPYSRRAEHVDLDEASQQALDWLQTQIPERTLHNWQNAAAKLIAQYLQELNRA